MKEIAAFYGIVDVESLDELIHNVTFEYNYGTPVPSLKEDPIPQMVKMAKNLRSMICAPREHGRIFDTKAAAHRARNAEWPRLKLSCHDCLTNDLLIGSVLVARVGSQLATDGVVVQVHQALSIGLTIPLMSIAESPIGDRMILAPQEINPDITVDDVKELVVELAALLALLAEFGSCRVHQPHL